MSALLSVLALAGLLGCTMPSAPNADRIRQGYETVHAADSKDAVLAILGAPTASRREEYLGLSYEELTWAPSAEQKVTATFIAGRLVSKAMVAK